MSSNNNGLPPAPTDAPNIARARKQAAAVVAPSLSYVRILNDDLAQPLNTLPDGGILSNQVAIGASLPLTQGWLKNGSITTEISATTFSGWEEDRNQENVEPSKHTAISDGYQAPKGERFNFTIAADKPFVLGKHQLDMGARVDLAQVTGKTHLQDGWHKMGMANYLRTQNNLVEDKPLLNAELTAAYRLNERREKSPLGAALLGGAALGNAYRGVMAGAELSIGSRASQYLPQTTHSASFGNSSITHLVQGGEAAPGTWKVTAYAKGYLSDKKDYRTDVTGESMAVTPYQGVLDMGYTVFGSDYLGKKTLLSAPVSHMDVDQYNIVDRHLGYKSVTLPATLNGYSFAPLNMEAGVQLQYQLSRSVTLGSKLSLTSNPVRVHANPNKPAAVEALGESYIHYDDGLLLSYPAMDGSIGYKPSNIGTQTFTQALDGGNDYMERHNPELIQHFKMTAPEKLPTMEFQAEISVTVSLGQGSKKHPGRHR